MYGLESQCFESRQKQKILHVFKSPVPFWSPLSLLFSGYRGSFPGVNQPPCEVNHSLPPSAEIKNGWSYISTSLIRPHGVDRNYFAFAHVPVRSIHVSYILHSICIQLINIDVTGGGNVSAVILFTSSDFLLTLLHLFLAYRTPPVCWIIPLFLL